MIVQSIFLLVAAALTLADQREQHKSCHSPSATGAPPTNTNIVQTVGAEIPLPENGGDRELEFPNGLVLKHVVLGHGYQNYTCKNDNSSNATGALAVLYDVTPFYPSAKSGLPSYNHWLSISSTCAITMDVPLQLDPESAAPRVSAAETQVNTSSPFFDLNTPIDIPGVGTLNPVGVHYFDGAGVPIFDIGKYLFKAKKLDSIPAPVDAPAGQNGEKAVAWLYLEDVGGSVNIDYVYRVNTVGGSGHTCDAVGDDSTEYTAYYYMYSKA